MQPTARTSVIAFYFARNALNEVVKRNGTELKERTFFEPERGSYGNCTAF